MADLMRHMNGHLLCVVDVETTGDTPGFNDMIQICVLPADSNLRPHKKYRPFYQNIKPKRPQNVNFKASTVHKLDMATLINKGIEPYVVEDMFYDWFNALNLPEGKKVAPLASNWVFDKGFIEEFFGKKAFDEHFHFHYRDTQVDALLYNDRADFHGEGYPFGRIGLNDLAAKFGIINEKAHDALFDCITTLEVYRRLVTMWTPIICKSTEDYDDEYEPQNDESRGSD